MRLHEIEGPAKPINPGGGVAPEKPAQTRKRVAKQQSASAKLQDVKAKAGLDIAAATRKLAATK